MAEQTGERSAQPGGNAQAPDWGLWLWWVVAGVVGWGVGWGLAGARSSSCPWTSPRPNTGARSWV